MPDLVRSLENVDFAHLQNIADLWGFELHSTDASTALPEVASQIFDIELITEVVEALPKQAKQALSYLLRNDGKQTWVQFTRRYGEVREIGPARRDREKPHLNPQSTAEFLWYRGLIAREFFETPSGPQEFAYIPDDLTFALAEVLPEDLELEGSQKASTFGRPAAKDEYAFPAQADDNILDDTCTALAAYRVNRDLPSMPVTEEFIQVLLQEIDVLDTEGLPKVRETRQFLTQVRGPCLLRLARAWLKSQHINDLKMLPGLKFEGEWSNDPLKTRQFLMDLVQPIPNGAWWSINGLIAAVKNNQPDFQRPAGDYDSWFIKDIKSERYLKGFDHWDQVDGALLRYMITGPLHWLGFLDLAYPADNPLAQPTAFRKSRWYDKLTQNKPPELPKEDQPIHIRSNGMITAPNLAPRAVRYQVARFCQWIPDAPPGEYRYRLTPASLDQARAQGLDVHHIFTVLGKHAPKIPPNIYKALNHWKEYGSRVTIEPVVILRVPTPGALKSLQDSQAGRFLGERLNATTTLVHAGAEDKVIAALLELGFLGEIIRPKED